jgi:ribosomal protein S5
MPAPAPWASSTVIGDVSGPHDSSSLMLSPAHKGDNVVLKSTTGIMVSTNSYKSLAMGVFVGAEH